MRVNVILENAEYGKFSNIKLCYNVDRDGDIVEEQVPLTFGEYERIYDFITDLTSIKFDFLLISAIVYGIDNLLSRGIYSNDGWTRDIKVEFPVYNLDIWVGKEEKLKQILDFLTGDNWGISFRQREDVSLFSPRKRRIKIPNYNKTSIRSVSLFSGGLDSLIGIIDELEKLRKGERILLVSHFDSKSPGPNSDQKNLLRELKSQYLDKIYWIQSKLFLSRRSIGNVKINIENNYRSRSLFFIGLGSYLSPIGTLIIPENGTISINYPLTPSRISSLSTRTTHPFVLKNISELFIELGISFIVSNPYTFKTKGEMFGECSNQNFLQTVYEYSVSCGKRRRKQHWEIKTGTEQCGRCMPCIYRRAALNRCNLDNEIFGNEIMANTSLTHDLPALFSYLKKNISLEQMKRDLLVNGNIDTDSLTDYAEMILRSKEEVLNLFRVKGNDFVKSCLGII